MKFKDFGSVDISKYLHKEKGYSSTKTGEIISYVKRLLEQNELSDKIKENENQKKQLTFLLKSNIIYRISLH